QIKNFRQRIAKEGPTPLPKAIGLIKSMKRSKFDETIEIHMSLGVDTSQSDQLVRGTVALPHGIGKTVRVVVFCQGDNVTRAKEAGADFAGSDDLLEKIQKQNWLDFDVALATQDMMGKVSRLGKVLGPRGLMPTPKAGTVVTGDVAAAVKDFKAGKVEYRTDKAELSRREILKRMKELPLRIDKIIAATGVTPHTAEDKEMESIKILRPQRAKLTPEESLKRMKDLPKRREKMIAAIRKSKN